MQRCQVIAVFGVVMLVVAGGCGGSSNSSTGGLPPHPSPTPTSRPTASPTPQASPTATPTATPTPVATPTAKPTSTPSATPGYALLYSFQSGTDGANPASAGLAADGGTLFGTTRNGGGVGCGGDGCGTVYSISTSGAERVLHRFLGDPDGAEPDATLTDAGGTLYGTTSAGGVTNGYGTVFSITTVGQESVLHSFASGTDGADPIGAGLLYDGGTLYGVTSAGGSNSNGTVFSLTTAGAEAVLYAFGNGNDGATPVAGLAGSGGTYLGTTQYGGANRCGLTGCGAVYAVTPLGTENVLYSFRGGSDGRNPDSPLLSLNGTYYGTTPSGGGAANCTGGCGTVFSISSSGAERVLYAFKGGTADGAAPHGGLVALDGVLYGTTGSGGRYGYGTIFSITTSGTETVLYDFAGGTDGAEPLAGLLGVDGTLYGTTSQGGGTACGGNGCGTVFALSPASQARFPAARPRAGFRR